MSTTEIKISKAEEKALDYIKAQLAEKKELPWNKPWSVMGSGLPYNYSTNNTFSGLNLLMCMFFETPEFATFKAIKDMGGKIKKGSKGVPLLRPMDMYFLDGKKLKFKEYKALSNDKKAECVKRVFFTNYYVFNIELQTEGITIERKEPKSFTPQLRSECDKLINHYNTDCPINIMQSDRAFYSPASDEITLPLREQFEKTELFYSTAFHEMIHSTGHQKRLERKGIVGMRTKESYAQEELVAEIGASILNAHYGIFDETKNTNAAYVQGWLKALKNNPEMLIQASKDSKKAVEYILKYS